MSEFQVPGFRFQVSEKKDCGLQHGTGNLKLGTRSGLTLIEVMLALAILGIGLAVLISTASKCLAVVKQSRNYETARHYLALVELEFKNKVLELEPGQDLEDGSGDVTFPESNQYHGKWEVATEGDEEDGLKKVVFRVSWSERGANPCEEVTTYLYVPQTKQGGTVVGK
jgi:prepilin-type N-terminal cleavage/methylation domain-containing protein